ncbi:MAG: tetraacyldisaccharide 4'-kinase [Nitrospiraceae bacterium]|nr:tetraacyldisaccharide 4'-kinase [Nitrospiraceae bacterium]
MYGRKRSALLELILSVLSMPYRFAVALRDWGYRSGVLRTNRLPCRVISVGNLTLGGTGKTPAVMAVAEVLLRKGRKPSILSRGYGRSAGDAVTVVSDGKGAKAGVAQSGDEPALMAARMQSVPVIVGRDRFEAGMTAVQRFHPDTAILDDGFQHRRLKRDVDIVLIDASDPFGNGKLFPAGILREPLASLRRASLVLITRTDMAADLRGLKEQIARFTKAPLVSSRHAPAYLYDTATGEEKPLTALRGTAVFAFAGIARPAAFLRLLASLGADVRGRSVYPDHYAYAKDDLADLFQQAVDCGAVLVVTTEKDSVKLAGMAPEGIWALRIDLEVAERDTWERVITGA